MAVAFVALLAALSGTAIALPGTNTVDSGDIINGQVKGKDIRNNAVTGKKVKNGAVKSADVGDNSLTGTDIDESTLGQVPSANQANNATNAGNAQTLQGQGPGSFAPASREAVRFVGTAGNPSYAGNWGDPGFPGDEEAGFLKDPYGIVHLYGNANRSGGTDDLIFTLPEGYRPAENLYFAAYGAGGTFTSVQVQADGDVNVFGPDTTFVGLGTISFPVLP
jgi:hypothetical protein